MKIDQKSLRFLFALAVALLFSASLLGCSPSPTPALHIGPGSSKAEVISALGEPYQLQDFTLPAEPFFGPQESLVNLVPPGTVLEEWVYEINDQFLYVWFTGEPGEPREDWLVLDTVQYPKDAVY